MREAAPAAADPASLATLGQGLVTVYQVAFALGTGIPALNALLLGWLLYRSRLVPRAIPVMGLIGAPMFTSFVIGYIMGVTGPGTAWHGIAVAPIFIWELSLGLWMTFKGFNRSAPVVAATLSEAGAPLASPTTLATEAGAA